MQSFFLLPFTFYSQSAEPLQARFYDVRRDNGCHFDVDIRMQPNPHSNSVDHPAFRGGITLAELKKRSKFAYQRGYGRFDDMYTLIWWTGLFLLGGYFVALIFKSFL